MQRLLRAAVLALCLSAPALPGPALWLRRASWAASCAASFWDLQTTRAAVSYGALEGNRFLARPDGAPRWGRIVGLKVGLCAGTAVVQEFRLLGRRHPAFADAAWTAGNAFLAGRFVAVSLRNRRVAAALRPPPAVPAYLLPD